MTPQAFWAPDLPDFSGGAPGLVHDMDGAIPGPRGFLPFKSYAEVSESLGATCLGAVAAVTSDGTLAVFAGTATHLYRLDLTDFSWDDVSGTTYSATAEAPWDFTVFGEYVIAVNRNDAPQHFQVGTDSAFSDVDSNAPAGGKVGVWGDQVVIGDQTDDPNQISWSDINDHTEWQTGSSGAQPFPDGGRVVGFTSSDRGLVIQERAIRRYNYTGDYRVYQFAKVADNSGSRYPASVISRDQFVFWLGEDGFYLGSLDSGIVSIGHNKINRWFLDTFGVVGNVIAAIDPAFPRVYWAAGSTVPNVFDTLLIYDWRLEQWAKVSVNLTSLFSYRTPGVTIEGLDSLYSNLDTMPISLDSRQFQGRALIVGGFGTGNKLGGFSGENAAARFVSAEMQPPAGRSGRARRVRPTVDVVDNLNVTVTAQTRKRRGDEWSTRTARTTNSRGWAKTNSSGAFHRFQTDIAAAADWADYQGVEIDFIQEGKG